LHPRIFFPLMQIIFFHLGTHLQNSPQYFHTYLGTSFHIPCHLRESRFKPGTCLMAFRRGLILMRNLRGIIIYRGLCRETRERVLIFIYFGAIFCFVSVCFGTCSWKESVFWVLLIFLRTFLVYFGSFRNNSAFLLFQ